MVAQAEQAYLQEANAWEADVYQRALSRSKVWGVIAAIAVAFASLCLLAVMMLLPLKSVEPFVIEVDKASGLVSVVKPLSDGGVSQNEAIIKYFIKTYITARESYLFDRYKQDYTVVQKMSNNKVAGEYHDWFHPSNDNSPLELYKAKGRVDVKIRNLSFIDEDTVTVPISRKVKVGTSTTESYDVITLSFQFMQTPQSESDRLINPLGFQVTAYRVDEQMMRE